MKATILFLIATAKFVQNANSANVPTFTVNRQATIRFPLEQENVDNHTTTERLLVDSTPPLDATKNWTTTTIKPTKSNSVQVIGNYSIAVQHASKVKIDDGAEEIIEQKSSLLEVLNFLRQLPREKLAEIYFGVEGNKNSASTTESVLEFLNDLREQQRTSTAATTTTTATTTKEPVPTLGISSTVKTTSTSIQTTTAAEDEVTIIFINEQEDYIDTTEKVVNELDLPPHLVQDNFTLVDNVSTSTEKIEPYGHSHPPLVSEDTLDKINTTPRALTTSVAYEFTDYPPPLPPPRINRDNYTDTSFAVGVAVGILACVVVLGGGATWCVCRRTCSFSTRNVYATMEAEEIPRTFTKPGPPIILPGEFDQVINKTRAGSIAKTTYSGQIEANRCVTEL